MFSDTRDWACEAGKLSRQLSEQSLERSWGEGGGYPPPAKRNSGKILQKCLKIMQFEGYYKEN